MKEEIKNLWVERLRDPNEKQIRGNLETHAGRCCLGVLCSVATKSGIDIRVQAENRFHNRTSYDGYTAGLPPKVTKWAGMVESENTQEKLVQLNDAQDYTFPDIADWIEANWEDL